MADLTAGGYAPKTVMGHYMRLKARAGTRDRRMAIIREVRMGRLRQQFPDLLPETLGEGTAIANWCDVVARDASEVLAPLPHLKCAAGRMRTDADKRRAERKDRIGDWYWRESALDDQMLYGADWYVTYGFLPYFIEPDYKRQVPIIQVDDPVGAYYERDRFFNVTVYAKTWWRTCDELVAMFPEYEGRIRSDGKGGSCAGGDFIEVIRWVDDTNVSLLLPGRAGLVLASYPHRFGRPPVFVATRPGVSMEDARGQFDDAVYVQLARAYIASLGLEAATKAVGAPLVVPDDVHELPIGPDGVIRTRDPRGVTRAGIELPPAAFQEAAQLANELSIGTRYPDARTGNLDASVVTGKGVQALLGSFDSQLKAEQIVIGHALRRATSMCFEMDEIIFPNVTKRVQGTLAGRSYEISYTPSKDIAGSYECDITYGFAAGMAPEQSFVAMLQLRGDAVISRDTFRENLPFDVDPEQEQRAVDVESTRDALKQGLFSLVQSAGPLLTAGQDPTTVLMAAAQVVADRENGMPVEQAILKAFEQVQAQKQAELEQMQAAQGGAGAPGAAGGPGEPPGVGPAGRPTGVAPGQAGEPPGGLPPIQSLIAGFRGGSPNLSANVSRKIPVGQ